MRSLAPHFGADLRQPEPMTFMGHGASQRRDLASLSDPKSSPRLSPMP
jgi:hypothetical protein